MYCAAMEFFVHGAKPGRDEAAYVALVGEGNQGEPEQRIAKVHFTHDGEELMAEVGKCVQRKDLNWRKADTAVVMAILPGNPLLVHTSAGLAAGEEGRSSWANPFLIGMTSVLNSWTFGQLE